MKKKIEELKAIRDNIDIIISMLSGEWQKKYLDGNGTIKEQIDCYDYEGKNLTDLINSIIEEHGSEPCPFGKGWGGE